MPVLLPFPALGPLARSGGTPLAGSSLVPAGQDEPRSDHPVSLSVRSADFFPARGTSVNRASVSTAADTG